MVKSGKSVCFVIPSLQAGGMERVMCELANFISAQENITLHMVLYGRDPSIFSLSIPLFSCTVQTILTGKV